jgi:hypothetical protein
VHTRFLITLRPMKSFRKKQWWLLVRRPILLKFVSLHCF